MTVHKPTVMAMVQASIVVMSLSLSTSRRSSSYALMDICGRAVFFLATGSSLPLGSCSYVDFRPFCKTETIYAIILVTASRELHILV
jgi:hypothetical protein